jgi:two-component system NtrC family sensor kinase
VGRLELKRRSIRLLDQQLRCTSYMASSMELSYAFFRDLKTALANLDVSAAWLGDALASGKPAELKDTVAQIKSEVGRCRMRIDKFLHFVRPAAAVIADTDVNALLEDLLAILASELAFKNINFRCDYQEHLPPIRSERGKIRQLFQNVVLNAVAAVEQNGEITVATRRAGIGVQVVIGDSGPGIPPEVADRIFEPLFTTKASGTGLGLAVCRSILDKIGGTIRLESPPDRGATFIIELPFRFTPQEV